jgi:hypothetical protein
MHTLQGALTVHKRGAHIPQGVNYFLDFARINGGFELFKLRVFCIEGFFEVTYVYFRVLK